MDYQTWIWEYLGKERHAIYCKRMEERREAMKRCKNEYERGQCWEAYRKLIEVEVDALEQSKGFPAKEYYMPELLTKQLMSDL